MDDIGFVAVYAKHISHGIQHTHTHTHSTPFPLSYAHIVVAHFPLTDDKLRLALATDLRDCIEIVYGSEFNTFLTLLLPG